MPHKSKEFQRRSKAAKKGWKTRRTNQRGIEIVVGYRSRDNGYSMTVHINPHRNLSDADVAELVSKLAASGHFDDSVNSPNLDLRWATFNNDYYVIRRGIRIPRGRATLVDFSRRSPGLP